MFGFLGVFLATPLTIVAVIAVKRLYLGDDEERADRDGRDRGKQA